MSCDLTVDTDGMRRAAELLEDAAALFRSPPSDVIPSSISGHALGNSARAREVAARARARSVQAVQLTIWQADSAAELAGRLRHSADLFDRIEHECHPGG